MASALRHDGRCGFGRSPFHGGIDVTGRWPLQSFLQLGALPSAVSCARLHTRHVPWDWGVSSLIDSTELPVSEVITDAVHISREMDIPPSVDVR